jgi:hypothetical protein
MFHWKFHNLLFRQLLRRIARPSSARFVEGAAQVLPKRFLSDAPKGFTEVAEQYVSRGGPKMMSNALWT